VCYFVLQAVLVTYISNGAGLDDAEQLANIGYLDWGYGGSQPPLYTWTTNLAASVLGTSMLTLQIVKFGMLASLFLSVFGAMRLLGFSRSVASASMLGLFLIPQIGWESQRALTHSVAGTAGCGWTFLAFAWHMRKRSVISAALLGVAMTAALLGKFNASFFLIMVIVTGLSVPEYRAVLLSKLSAVTLLAFAICVGPTATWMFAHKSSVIARSGKLQMGASGNLFFDRLNGIESFVEAAFLFSVLALAIAAIIALIHIKKRTVPTTPYTPGETFMRRSGFPSGALPHRQPPGYRIRGHGRGGRPAGSAGSVLLSHLWIERPALWAVGLSPALYGNQQPWAFQDHRGG
jgi:hypothetical protein